MEIIALDSHKRYSQVCVQKENGQILCEGRIDHVKGEIEGFLSRWTEGSPVAMNVLPLRGNGIFVINRS